MQRSVFSVRGAHVLAMGLMPFMGQLPDLSLNPAMFAFHCRVQILVSAGTLPNLWVSPKNFEKIRRGMTENEVKEVLGTPRQVEDLSRYSVTKVVPAGTGVRHFRVMKTSTWIGLDRVICVDFGEKGTVEFSGLMFLETWAELENLDIRSLVGRALYWLTEPLCRFSDE